MKKWIVCLVIGLGMLAFSTGAGINDDTIRCGSEIMSPGDVCEETRGGSVTDTETYEEMKESKEAGQRTFNSWGRWVLLGGGLLLTGLGIWGIVKVKRARKNEPDLAPGHTSGEARQPGQPVGQYVQGMPLLPPGSPGGPPPPGYPLRQYPPPYPHYSPFPVPGSVPYPNDGSPQGQAPAAEPNCRPPQEQGPAPQSSYSRPEQNQVPHPNYGPSQERGPASQPSYSPPGQNQVPHPNFGPFQQQGPAPEPHYSPAQQQDQVSYPDFGPQQQSPAPEPNYGPPQQYPPFGPGSQ